ncbi:MAG: cysteine desulfurase [Lachnospiraceae bacterium]|nr:cysteine desulfurase [Lachnospiraceae bacterium]
MEAYLDNSATTFVLPEVKDICVRTMTMDFGNPSSLHKKGMEAEQYVRVARETIAGTLKVDPKEITFTSGGTESNNLALIGGAMAHRRTGKHIITTQIEHSSVANPVKFLEKEGFRVTYLPVSPEGLVDRQALLDALDEDTSLVSIMQVNNEIGALEPVAELGRLVHEKNPDILFHVDAIQSYGKFIIRPRRENIDLLSVSGHKIHGPKGSGFLYVRSSARILPQILGGGQQQGMRSGTENVPAIAGLGVAAGAMYQNYEEHVEKLFSLRERLVAGLSGMDGVTINGPKGREGAPHIVSASFEGIRAEVLLHALEEREIYVSSGSACSSNHPVYSATLTAIGVRKDLLDCTVRFSLSIFNTEAQIDYTLDVLNELVPKLSRYRRR